MAVGIGLRFVAGKYHATPWSKHVNEGAVEWPPSPWRLLRSLVAAWQMRAGAVDAAAIAAALSKLASPPEYRLPPATPAHTRHYMPLFREKRSLVFDTFLVVGADTETVALWPSVVLESSERAALAAVLDSIGYFGRAESWCTARLLSDSETGAIVPNCSLKAEGGELEAVRTLAADPEVAVRCDEPPNTWPLCAATADLRRKRWSDPPGSQWVTYMRPKRILSSPAVVKRAHPASRATVVRYALNGPVAPPLTETLSFSELARKAVQGIYGEMNQGGWSAILSGKSADGCPLAGHSHAFYLPTDDDRDGRLDHMAIYAPNSFPDLEMAALDQLRFLRQVGGRPPLQVVLTGVGTVADFHGMPWFGPARRWRSATPFVPVRHTKLRQGEIRESPASQIVLELQRRGFPTPLAIEGLERCELSGGRSVRWIQFRRQRMFGGGTRGQSLGYGFELVFADPVTGPLALGYGCHFGLGLFRAVAE